MAGTRKKSDGGFFSRLAARLLSPFVAVPTRLILCLAVIAGLAAVMYVGWQWIGERVADDPNYRLTAEKIHVTPPPEWIRSDVAADVARHGLAESGDIRDPELTVHLAQAFAMHPWVANVRRVSKQYPAEVVVELEYRRPAAMVEIVSPEGKRWLYPVDAQGVLLPTQDFSPEQALTYPRLNAGATMPAGPVGSAWGDRGIHGGALIAAALSVYWHPLGLYRIEAVGAQRPPNPAAEPTFDLVTRAGTRVLWGHHPGAEEAREPNCETKVQRLLAYAQENGGLDSPNGPVRIDLRSPAGATRPSQAAMTPANMPR